MNYLAHAYLSFSKPGILAGNLISDFVKGKKQYDYPAEIFRGIKLHRAIDEFTDNHECIKEIKAFFRNDYRLYAAVFTDIVCDYFLANDKNEFPSVQSLASFSQHTYVQLQDQIALLPENFQQIFVYMQQYDWLYNYHLESGIQHSFAGVVRRSRYMKESSTAFNIFIHHKDKMKVHYNQFFPLLKKFSQETLHKLEKTV